MIPKGEAAADALDEEEIPEDLHESDRYLEVPHKNDLDLGRRLALRFVEEELPDAYGQVQGFFSRRGAHARFKDFLAEAGCLEKWCSVHQITLIPSDGRSA